MTTAELSPTIPPVSPIPSGHCGGAPLSTDIAVIERTISRWYSGYTRLSHGWSVRYVSQRLRSV
jgi:hypothetical protein